MPSFTTLILSATNPDTQYLLLFTTLAHHNPPKPTISPSQPITNYTRRDEKETRMCWKLELTKRCKLCDSARDSQAHTKLCDEAKKGLRGRGEENCRMGVRSESQSVDGYECLKCREEKYGK